MPDDKVRFLVVDDLEGNIAAIEGLLAREGLEIMSARSGAGALELLLAHDFSLALVDVQMPGMDGFELAELMRGTERTRQIPIIFITAVATDEQRRFRGYELGAIDYVMKPIEPQVLRNKADLFFRLERKRRDLLQQTDELRQLHERLKAHTENSPLAIIEFDADYRITFWSAGAERMFGWSAQEVLGKALGQWRWVHEEDAASVAAVSADMLAGKTLRNVHVNRNYRKDGAIIHCEWYNSALLDKSGKLVSVRSEVLDVTSRKQAEEHRTMLLNELNHRVKNTLATVQAIATQTFKSSEFGDKATDAFHGRLAALSSAHDILTRGSWESADLRDLVTQAVKPYGGDDPGRFRIDGPIVYLNPKTAVAMSMGLHELCTNAAKYGALSRPEGRVSITWSLGNGVAPPQLRFRWEETDGPKVEAPKRRGFGSRLIERLLAEELNAEIALDYRTAGLVCTLDAPLPVIGGDNSVSDR